MARAEPISKTVWPEIAYLAQQVRRAREEAKMTQREFAQKLDISQAYIAHLEMRRVNPQLLTLVTLARALGKDLSYFILDRNNPDQSIDSE